MVAPSWLSDQWPVDNSRWSTVPRFITKKMNPETLRNGLYLDVAMVPNEHILVRYKDHGFHFLRNNEVITTPQFESKCKFLKKRASHHPTMKVKYSALKKFSKKKIDRLIEEQLINDSILFGI